MAISAFGRKGPRKGPRKGTSLNVTKAFRLRSECEAEQPDAFLCACA